MSIVYLYGVTAVLLYYSKDHAKITFWVLILHALIVLVLYFKNNKRNGRLFSTLKEYEDVKKVHLLSRPYKNIVNFTRIIIVLDALLWPAVWPLKFLFFIFYKIFRHRMRKVKKLILKGGLVFIPDEEAIMKDPFYSFLMREGLYESSFEFVDEEDEDEEEEVEAKDEGEPEEESKSKKKADKDSSEEEEIEEVEDE